MTVAATVVGGGASVDLSSRRGRRPAQAERGRRPAQAEKQALHSTHGTDYDRDSLDPTVLVMGCCPRAASY